MEFRGCTVQLAAVLVVLSGLTLPGTSQLDPRFYYRFCPAVLPVIQGVVQRVVNREQRMGASLLRLHFHDCFVNGCDGSILLDGNDGEKEAAPNRGTARGFEVIDEIKQEVNRACGRSDLVSCADILTVAARDSIVALGGPWYEVPLGRRDSRPRQSSRADAENAIPGPDFNFQRLLAKFNEQGLSIRDLVVLSSAHTLGFSKCRFTRTDNQAWLLQKCPRRDDTLVGMDDSPTRFDNDYYLNLIQRRGVLQSDQELFRGNNGESDQMVWDYSRYPDAHRRDFAQAMVKLGNIRPLTQNEGEIRTNCRVPNNPGQNTPRPDYWTGQRY